MIDNLQPLLFDGEVDPEIVDVIWDLNNLGFLETLWSCAGYGRSGWRNRPHLREDHPYLVIRYRDSDVRSSIFHYDLGMIANHVQWFNDLQGYGYYFRPDHVPSRLKLAQAHQRNKDAWDWVRVLVGEWKEN